MLYLLSRVWPRSGCRWCLVDEKYGYQLLGHLRHRTDLHTVGTGATYHSILRASNSVYQAMACWKCREYFLLPGLFIALTRPSTGS